MIVTEPTEPGRRVKISCWTKWIGSSRGKRNFASLSLAFFDLRRRPGLRDVFLFLSSSAALSASVSFLTLVMGKWPFFMFRARFSFASATAWGEMSSPKVLTLGNFLPFERRE